MKNSRKVKKHKKYGGEITIEDFSTSSPSRKRLQHQADAERENSNRNRYKGMTLEELREMKSVSNTDGRPSPTLTDKQWQDEFEIRKMFVKPFPEHIKRMSNQTSMFRSDNTFAVFNGETSYHTYCAYINDILKTIRSGQHDYCYYIYQIMDLLRFHHDTLRTKYCDRYWEVWLEE